MKHLKLFRRKNVRSRSILQILDFGTGLVCHRPFWEDLSDMAPYPRRSGIGTYSDTQSRTTHNADPRDYEQFKFFEHYRQMPAVQS